MHIAIINGPNLNLLGSREPEIYGSITYQELLNQLQLFADSLNVQVTFFQSNHEGDIVDFIQQAANQYDGLIINAAAYTHTSIAILDALLAVQLPSVEVHLSDPDLREQFRKTSYLRQACCTHFQGEGIISYQKALQFLQKELASKL